MFWEGDRWLASLQRSRGVGFPPMAFKDFWRLQVCFAHQWASRISCFSTFHWSFALQHTVIILTPFEFQSHLIADSRQAFHRTVRGICGRRQPFREALPKSCSCKRFRRRFQCSRRVFYRLDVRGKSTQVLMRHKVCRVDLKRLYFLPLEFHLSLLVSRQEQGTHSTLPSVCKINQIIARQRVSRIRRCDNRAEWLRS